MFKTLVLLSILSSVYSLPEVKISVNRLKSIADEVNAKQTTWTAGLNFDINEDVSEIDLSHTVGVVFPPNIKNRYVHGSSEYDDSSDTNESDSSEERANNCEDNGLPENFDSRKNWPHCKIISHIYDQGNCGSCWAVATVSAFTDRVCIKTGGKVNTLRSVQQMLSCCHKCGSGCQGGWPLAAWQYLIREGAVSGGDYNSKEGCQPYLVKPCSHHVNSKKLKSCSSYPIEKTRKCKLHCYNKKYSKTYRNDKVKALTAYAIEPCSAQNEIYHNGSIVASFPVYEDFYTYKSGVYQHVTGKYIGYHAARVIGWGVEKDSPYWLVANSWNTEWGDKGLFKILKGENEILIEENFVAGGV